MKRNEIPTAEFEVFSDGKFAENYISNAHISKFVIKEDGLRAGKGVFICESRESARAKILSLEISENSPVVIEEFLEGFEISALCFTDGTLVKMMPFSQDHKRALDGDRGENTGGMGAVAPVYLSQSLEKQIEQILQKSVDGLKAEEKEYRGMIYKNILVKCKLLLSSKIYCIESSHCFKFLFRSSLCRVDDHKGRTQSSGIQLQIRGPGNRSFNETSGF